MNVSASLAAMESCLAGNLDWALTSERFLVVGLERGQWNRGQMWARDDDNVRPVWWPISTEHLSNQSFSKISLHSAADFSRRRNP